MKTRHDKMGFSLMELMIALGILGVGLMMIATAFPSAMLENKKSTEDTMATLVAENATAICRVRLKHATINGTVGAQLQDISSNILVAERAYPITQGTGPGDGWIEIPEGSGTYYPSSRYGWLVAARQPTNDVNDYRLVIVPYCKFLWGDSPPTFSTVVVNGAGTQITSGNVSVGSPVISTADESFAYVIDCDGNLSGIITGGSALAVGADGTNSPAVGCYVVRTAVAP